MPDAAAPSILESPWPDALPADALRWRCPARDLPESTEVLSELPGVVGQDSAVEALRFGLECQAPGQNVFVRGLTGTGRMTLVHELLDKLKPNACARKAYGYVHNFSEPDRPRLITLASSEARRFKRRVRELAETIRDHLAQALEDSPLKSEREAIETRRQEELEAVTGEFEKELRAAGLELVTLQRGPITMPAILPVVEGKPVGPDVFERMHDDGKISDEEYAAYREKRKSFQKRLNEVTEKVHEIQRRTGEALREIAEASARRILEEMVRPLRKDFPGEDVGRFLDELTTDVVENRLFSQDKEFDPVETYGVNILLDGDCESEDCPVVVENTPTLFKLLGTVEREWGPQGPLPSDYRMIRAGSLLRANGGYLILDARDILMEPGAWKVLERALRTGELEIVPPELVWGLWGTSLKPEPIPLQVRVILVGDAWIYYMLDAYDPDFSHLFKVLADFDSVIDRDDGTMQYAGVLARIAREEKLPPFERSALAALVEHGARIASLRGKLTARFGRVADVAREAAFLARKDGRERVEEQDVDNAIRRTKERGDLSSRRFRELVRGGVLHVQTEGEVVGQINGLAVIQAGPVSYGFPARITASVGAGSAGVVNIDGQSELSGSVHTKGFHILGGLLRNLLKAEHPLAFSASLTFEQSYGTIDGDSASCAEICCLLSGLTGIAIRQGVAITGSIDQLGRVQAIGGVNEKIEGFFDVCEDLGLGGGQGVIIPRSNVGDLMLRRNVVDACAAGKFRVFAVDRVEEALAILTGRVVGEPDEDGFYPEDTVLGKAQDKARELWLKSTQDAKTLFGLGDEGEESGGHQTCL